MPDGTAVGVRKIARRKGILLEQYLKDFLCHIVQSNSAQFIFLSFDLLIDLYMLL